jgi:AraC family ethanolamine operon transcriptional activator
MKRINIKNSQISVKDMNEPAFYLHQQINDFDEFCVNARNWDLDYRQLEAGDFHSELLMFGNEHVLFTRATIGRRLLQQGSPPPGLVTFGLMTEPNINMYWRNIDVCGDHLFIFPPGSELHSISQADFDVFVVSLSEEKLDQVCASYELPGFHDLVNHHEVFQCKPQRLSLLRSLLLQNEQAISAAHDLIDDVHYLETIENVLADQLIGLLADCTQPVSRNALRKRDLALQSAESYIHESGNKVVTIPELCEVCNASQRTLEYAFRERYGLTPKEYTLIYRLNHVRKLLIKASPENNHVSAIAQQHGFWHMGQFSASYRKLFTELPSETLKQSR